MRTPRLLRGIGCASVVLLVSSACSSLRHGANPEVPLWQNRPGDVISIAFQQPLSIPSRSAHEAYEKGRPTIDAKNRRVFVGSSDRGLYALHAEDGKVIWRFETLGSVQSEPLYDPKEDVIYFGSNDGALYKVRAKDGTMLWRFMSYAEVERMPILSKGTLFFTNANDTIVAADPQTGKMKWSQHRAPIGGMSVAGHAGPAIWKDKVYVAFSDGNVMAYETGEGVPVWQPVDLSGEAEQTLGYQIPKYFDVDTTPVVAKIESGPVVFVGAYDGGVFALDAETGAKLWSNERATGVTNLVMWSQPAHPPRDGGPLVPARRMLIASSGTTGLWGLDPEDGGEKWRRALPEGGVSQPAVMAGALLLSTTRHGIFLISPLNGGVIDGIDLGMGFSMSPAGHGYRAYLMSDGGSWFGLHVTPPT